VIPTNSTTDLLRQLALLRWVAVAGQATTIAFVSNVMLVQLPLVPLCLGVASLALFNIYASWRSRTAQSMSVAELYAHLVVDIAELSWVVGWSGGVENPFSSLFLLPIALSTFSLPRRWLLAVTACAVLGFALAVLLGRPLPHIHGVFGDSFDVHKLGMLVNFLVTAAMMLFFLARFAEAWRTRESELATLRERFARNEGIVALATHAASVAHELNTPLATLTLLTEELREQASDPALRDDLAVIRHLVDRCRDRVRELASPAQVSPGHARVELESTVEQWRLFRPTVELIRTNRLDGPVHVDAAVGHLLLVLLNNAADASEQAGVAKVELALEAGNGSLEGRIRDYGVGFDHVVPKLPGELMRTSKPGGLGIGLALSHATMERLGGELSMTSAGEGGGVIVSFRLPFAA
jgi:two-component system sensor histidine kinase RegB